VYGAKIQGNILLPVGTIIKIEITLKNLQQKITSLGKVKWNKFIIDNESYEAGVEFVDTPDEAIQKLYERIQKDDVFISVEEWSNLQEINKKEEISIAKQIKKTIETVEADMKNCRYCNQKIKTDAVECIHCGELFNQEITRKVFI